MHGSGADIGFVFVLFAHSRVPSFFVIPFHEGNDLPRIARQGGRGPPAEYSMGGLFLWSIFYHSSLKTYSI
jgi:hypothetical protein